jgi:hypothetical protein
MCSTNSLNTTEKIRLNNELNGWLDRHAQMNFVELRQNAKPFLIHNSPKMMSNATDVVKLSETERRNNRLAQRLARAKDKTAESTKEQRKARRLSKPIKMEEW